MKTLLAAAAGIALLAAAGPVSAQSYQVMPPAMPPPTQVYPPMQAPVQPMQQPTFTSGTMGAPAWMMDDGSSSDYPIHNPGDISGDRLNAQYSGGLTTAPGTGLPALPGQ